MTHDNTFAAIPFMDWIRDCATLDVELVAADILRHPYAPHSVSSLPELRRWVCNHLHQRAADRVLPLCAKLWADYRQARKGE